MERGRILIAGGSRESTYELRNMLDSRRYELEIALTPETAKAVLVERWMNLLVLHTDLLEEKIERLLEFLHEREIEIPVLVVGEQAEKFRQLLNGRMQVECFEKPYQRTAILDFIHAL